MPQHPKAPKHTSTCAMTDIGMCRMRCSRKSMSNATTPARPKHVRSVSQHGSCAPPAAAAAGGILLSSGRPRRALPIRRAAVEMSKDMVCIYASKRRVALPFQRHPITSSALPKDQALTNLNHEQLYPLVSWKPWSAARPRVRYVHMSSLNIQKSRRPHTGI